jgi:hypothetical protein
MQAADPAAIGHLASSPKNRFVDFGSVSMACRPLPVCALIKAADLPPRSPALRKWAAK